MAAQKTSSRRKYVDIVVLVLIGLCVLLIGMYQVQGAADVLMSQPEPTPSRTVRPNSGFVPPNREPEDHIGTLVPQITAPPPTLSPEPVDDQEEDN
jgi:hypothetical protein